MPTIIIFTSGTLGDHLPYIALGRALAARGYRVRMAINQAMHEYARRAGLEAVALTDVDRGEEQAREHAADWDHWNNSPATSRPKAAPMTIDQYVGQVRELVDLCRDADLLIATAIRTQGYLAAEALGLPWLTVSMNPFTFWQPTLPEEQEAQWASWLKYHDRFAAAITHTFAQLGVDKEAPPCSVGWLFARHVLLASSPCFSRPNLAQLQPRSSIDMTGFWFYEDPAWRDWQPDEALAAFCRRRPIVLSFSSQPLEDPRRVLQVHVEAAARLGLPLLVQRGWANFSEADLPPNADPREIMFADFLPHDWLFAQAACTVQHGGIGSIARALRQGCPLLIEPFGNDQLYNASRVVNLGAGAAMHPFKMTAEGLAQVLHKSVLTDDCRRRAAALGDQIEAENGLETACGLIDAYLDRARSGGDDSAALLVNPHPPALHAAARVVRDDAEAVQHVPKILHQTWRDANVPPEFVKFQRTWQDLHPDWTYYLWTDWDNREFLRRHYPWFLSIYDKYHEPIMRADAARYFILHHFGGVYADLDAECLRPLDPLVDGTQIVAALEPEQHLRIHQSQGYPLDHIVCNAVIASPPGHPFWEHVFKQLVAYHLADSPLDATGPFLLTRAYDAYPHKETIRIEAAHVFSPIDGETTWRELAPEARAELARSAYAVHHWRGTWWRPGMARQTEYVKLSLLLRGGAANVSTMRLDVTIASLRQLPVLPRISCLMVTRNRFALAQRAVRCFQGQSYPNRELVILDDGEDGALAEWVAGLDDDRIVYVRLPAQNQTLGELRNLAVAQATGAYVAQWDDDDLSDPARLEVQLAAIHLMRADACTLERELLWWPERRRLAVSNRRIWEGAFVCARDKLPPYPTLARGEDTPIVDRVVETGRVAVLDYPALYTYVFHGDNTFGGPHWEAHWRAATEHCEDDQYDIMIQRVQSRLKVDLTPWIVRTPDRDAEPAATAPYAPTTGRAAEPNTSAGVRSLTPREDGAPAETPAVLVLVPVKDAAPYLPHLWENLKALTYPHERISLAFLESDSVDGTHALIQEHLPALRAEYARVELFKYDYGYRTPGPRWEASQQFRRRSVLALSRNYLLSRALRDEEWVLWVDADVARWPDDVIRQLLASGKEIVVPNCLSLATGETFDYNTFKLKPGAENLDWAQYVLGGILLPPHGYGRFYLSDLRQHDCVEVDGVGGTMLMIRADLHRQGLIFPPFSYKFYIETEGLAFVARDMGYRCWGLPNLEIFHP